MPVFQWKGRTLAGEAQSGEIEVGRQEEALEILRKKKILIYFAAFKNHVGLYPPVKGDTALLKAVAPYAGEKGNLRFPLDQPIPYELIERIVKLRAAGDSTGSSKG